MVESRLGLGGVLREEIQEEAVSLLALALGRLKEAAEDAAIFESFWSACPG